MPGGPSIASSRPPSAIAPIKPPTAASSASRSSRSSWTRDCSCACVVSPSVGWAPRESTARPRRAVVAAPPGRRPSGAPIKHCGSDLGAPTTRTPALPSTIGSRSSQMTHRGGTRDGPPLPARKSESRKRGLRHEHKSFCARVARPSERTKNRGERHEFEPDALDVRDQLDRAVHGDARQPRGHDRDPGDPGGPARVPVEPGGRSTPTRSRSQCCS